MTETVRDTSAMIARMTPELVDGDYVFCTTADAVLATKAQAVALAWFQEAEGVSLILVAAEAVRLGFDGRMPMRRIVLHVYSALDGVGLTAAVSNALAAHNISCNMVAAFHHDHVFVPAARAGEALAILQALQAAAR